MRTVRLLFASLAFLILAAPAPAVAAPGADNCRKAAAALDGGNYDQAIDLIRAALSEAWLAAPLTLRNVTWVTEEPQAFGIYKPRPHNRFAPGETIHIYMEPVGYTVKEEKEQYTFGLTVDFNLLDDKGKVLGGQKEFGQFGRTGYRFNTEFMLYLYFNISGIPDGKYFLEITANDQYGKKTATLKLPFNIQ